MATSRQLLPSAVRDLTTPRYSPAQNTGYSTGVRIDIDMTTVTSTKNATFAIEGYDRVADEWFALITSAAQTSTGRIALQVDPRLAAVTNLTANAILPSQFRLKASGTDTLSEFSAQMTLTD